MTTTNRSMGTLSRLVVGLGCLLALAGCGVGAQPSASTAQQVDPDPACHVQRLQRAARQGFKVYAPDGRRFVVNDEDERGVPQIYLGDDSESEPHCLTCADVPEGPKRQRAKMQPRWHPSGKWLMIAVERDKYSTPPLLGWSKDYVEGQLQNGLWTDMYAITSDGKTWRRMTEFRSGQPGVGDGYTGPAFTSDGQVAVWSQAMDGNIVKYYPFGRWQLTMADVVEERGMPRFVNVRDITPKGMNWNEPGDFHPDGQSLLLSGSTQKDAQGMDQYILNVRTGGLVNLTNSPRVWDEHGVFSPDGEKILFMSAYPYRDDPSTSKVLTIKTEFMLMEVGGTPTQLTHFRTKGYPESSLGIAAAGAWSPDGSSLSLRTLVFPNYEDFELTFQGHCGRH